MTARVVVLDYGSGNVHSAVRALERVGADVELTADPRGGAGRRRPVRAGRRQLPRLHARAARGRRGPAHRPCAWPAGARCSGSASGCRCCSTGRASPAVARGAGWGSGPARSTRLPADGRAAHGLVDGDVAGGSRLFAGVEDERFYFVHSYAVQQWVLERRRARSPRSPPRSPGPTHGAAFVAAVENGPLSATQFHPEKSGDAGAHAARATGCGRCDRAAAPRIPCRPPEPRTVRIARNRKGTELP